MKGPSRPAVVVVGQVDLRQNRPSGIKTYVRLLAKGLVSMGTQAEAWDLGPSAPSPGLPQGDSETTVPHVIPFWHRLAARLLRTRLPAGVIIHAQRPEELLPCLIFRPRARLVVTIHGPHWRTVRRKFGALAALLYQVVCLVVLYRVDRAIVVSPGLAEELGRGHAWFQRKVRVIPPMIDTDDLMPVSRDVARDRLQIRGGSPVILFCGRVEKEKNLSMLLDAIGRFRTSGRTAQLVVCGSGSHEAWLASVAGASGIPITFLGERSPREMPWVYGCADCLVVTSDYEGFPTVVLEALACGTPVVSKRFPGLEVLLADGVPLRLVSSDSVMDFAATLESVLELARPAGAWSGVDDYSYATIARRVLRVYEEIGH